MDSVNLQHGQQKMRQAPAAPRRYDGQAGNPLYDPQQGGHYGTSVSPCAATLRDAAHALCAFTAEHQADSISQAPLHLYVFPARPRPHPRMLQACSR